MSTLAVKLFELEALQGGALVEHLLRVIAGMLISGERHDAKAA